MYIAMTPEITDSVAYLLMVLATIAMMVLPNDESKPKIALKLLTKVCTKCNLAKVLSAFYAPRYTYCKECICAEQRERNKANKEKDKQRRADPTNKSKLKHCYVCNKKQPLLLFALNRNQC